MYAKISSGAVDQYPVTLNEIRQANPDVSFPAEPTDESLAPFGYAVVHDSPQPAFDPSIEHVVENTPIFDGAKWIKQWRVEPLPPEPVPTVISKLGLKYALGAQWPTVRNAIMADPALKEDWELTTSLHRNSPLVNGTAAALGFTPAQMDDIFRAAAKVTV